MARHCFQSSGSTRFEAGPSSSSTMRATASSASPRRSEGNTGMDVSGPPGRVDGLASRALRRDQCGGHRLFRVREIARGVDRPDEDTAGRMQMYAGTRGAGTNGSGVRRGIGPRLPGVGRAAVAGGSLARLGCRRGSCRGPRRTAGRRRPSSCTAGPWSAVAACRTGRVARGGSPQGAFLRTYNDFNPTLPGFEGLFWEAVICPVGRARRCRPAVAAAGSAPRTR